MNKFLSPLRYPGGKAKIASFLRDIILLNNLEGKTFWELYAGGAGVSLFLLFENICDKIVINDLDYKIYAFWKSILNHTDEFISKIEKTEINIDEWTKQKTISVNPEKYSELEVGFSTFFLNRSNRSGILTAGPIGGIQQNGNFLIDVRFNKPDLIRRISKIAEKKDRIIILNNESIDLLKNLFTSKDKNSFIFLDPPYYIQGANLYFNNYKDPDHSNLSELLSNNRKSVPWFLTYDNCSRIKELYQNFRNSTLPMTYTLQKKTKTKEIMVFSDELQLPKTVNIGKRKFSLNELNEND